MPDDCLEEKRLESMLFNHETSLKTDFRNGEIKPPIATVYKEKPGCVRIRPPPLKDIHTLVDWAVPIVPFNLFHKPKEVVRTNPNVVQTTFLKPEDEGREHAQKTRPRLVMTPGVSLDDVEKESRDLIVPDVYITTAQKTTEEAVLPATSVRAPLPGAPAPANPLTLQKLQAPPVSPEWRMDSVTWDLRQLRTFCDPTMEFWLARTPKCDVCNATAARESQKKMERQMRRRS